MPWGLFEVFKPDINCRGVSCTWFIILNAVSFRFGEALNILTIFILIVGCRSGGGRLSDCR